MNEKTFAEKWAAKAPYVLSLVRIVPAIMIMFSGTMMLFGFPETMEKGGGTVQLFSQAGIGGLLMFVGGFLLTIGLFTRPVAFVLSGEMAVAFFQFHAPHGWLPNTNGGTAAVLYSFLWFYIAFAGDGKWSVDEYLKKRKNGD